MSVVESVLTWLDPLYGQVDRLPLAYAMGAGVLASINPCGFIMLPTYATLFVRGDATTRRRTVGQQLGRALGASAAMTLGFVALFGTLGLVVSAGGRSITEYFPYTSLVVGALLVLTGVALLMGGVIPELPLPSTTLTDTASLRGMFLYGLAYAAASLGCALPVFLIVVGAATASSSWLTSMVQFLNFALGMGLVVTAVSISIALSREGLVRLLRRGLPHTGLITGVFLILGGAYLIAYWVYVGRQLSV
jgi:cytochrome c biogenesis protein CcdA